LLTIAKMFDAHSFSQMIGVLIILYLAMLLLIAQRLKRLHRSVWNGLGSPSLLNWSIANSFQLGNFVFLRGSYRSLKDINLSRMIWAVRIMFLVIASALLVWVVGYHGGQA